MKQRRDKYREAQPADVRASWPAWLRRLLAVGSAALVVATTLVPSEGAVHEGTYAALATCWCLVFVLWSIVALLEPGTKLALGWTEIAGGAFVAWHSLTALLWMGHGNDRQTLNALWLMIGYGLTALLLRRSITSPRIARALILVMIWLATTLAALGYVQYFVTLPAMRARYEQNPARFLTEQGISTDLASPERQLFVGRLRSVEPLATFALTNSLAGFIAPWLIVTLAVGLTALGDRAQRRTLIAATVVAALLAGCLLLTKSRTAVLACAVGVVLLAIYGTRRGRLGSWIGWKWPALAAAVLMVIGLGVVYVGGLDAQVLSEAPKSVLYRLEYWRATAALIADHPVWGCGPGNFQEAYSAYKLPQASEMVRDPHNFLLEIWAIAGTPAIVLLLATLAALVVDLSWAKRGNVAAPAATAPESTQDLKQLRMLVVGGCAGGLVLGAVVAWLSGFPLEMLGDTAVPWAWCIGLPLAFAAWWAFGAWVWQGELPLGAVIVGGVVLLINLLAAGALMFPGVVVTALVLLPIALSLAAESNGENSGAPEADVAGGDWPIPSLGRLALSRPAAGGLVAAAFLLTVACLRTEYQPVLLSRSELRIAHRHLQQGQGDDVEASALASAAFDPLSPDPWRLLAEIRVRRYLNSPDAANWQSFVAAADEFRRRNPRHHGQFFLRGNWYFLAWQRGQQPQTLAEALSSYREAIARYPNWALYHGQFAWALQAAGRQNEARQEADRAQELDDAMPHVDQKLATLRIADWQPSPAGSTPLTRPETAELTVETLRTTTGR